jgi:glutathione/glutaredoxin type arsenate reductase
MFICQTNARRSQMAEGFARSLGKGVITAASAGLEPSQIDPLAVEAMAEVGIDISDQTSKPLSDFNPQDYDAVISLCGCGVNLPAEWVSRDIFQDWELEDPKGQPIETFRRVRDQIKEKVETLIQSLTVK